MSQKITKNQIADLFDNNTKRVIWISLILMILVFFKSCSVSNRQKALESGYADQKKSMDSICKVIVKIQNDLMVNTLQIEKTSLDIKVDILNGQLGSRDEISAKLDDYKKQNQLISKKLDELKKITKSNGQ